MARFEKGDLVFDVGNPATLGRVTLAGEEVSEVCWPSKIRQYVTHQHLVKATEEDMKQLQEMTGQELLTLYNKHAASPRASKFQSKEQAVEKIRKVMPHKKTDSRTIEVVAKTNPHREGTAHYAYFEGMVSGETVEEYKDRYPDQKARRDATLYLHKDVRSGYVKLKA